MLLIIDPNNDFADSHGSLYVPNANKAIEAIAHYINENNPEAIAISQTHTAVTTWDIVLTGKVKA